MQYFERKAVLVNESVVTPDANKSRIAEIFIRERSRLLSFVRRQVHELSSADAEDIVSEVTYSLLRRADVVEQVENLTAYVYRSLANRVIDRHRKEMPTVPIDSDGEPTNTTSDLQDERPRPDRRLEHSELRRRLQEAIGQLTPRERAVWTATEIDGRSYRDLAEEWDEPIGTLLSLKSRATARLRTLLSDYKSNRRS